MARNMRRKPTPLAPKMKLTPRKGIKSPPRSEPMMPETSSWSPERVYAEANSSAETISAIAAELAGALNANPRLKRNAPVRMR